MPGPINTARSLLVAYLLAGVAACSGGKASGEQTTAGYTMIDDMEGDGRRIAWTPPGVSPGGWWATTDCTEGDRIAPLPYFVVQNGWSYATLPAARETFSGIVSTHAARLRTTAPLVGIWGANIGFNFNELANDGDGGPVGPLDAQDASAPRDGQPCRQSTSLDFPGGSVDLSAYAGIRFWGNADPAGARTIRVQLNDRNTDPRAGVCNAANPSADVDCYNGFGTQVVLADTPTQYTVYFSSLQQKPGWGYRPDPSVPDLRHVYDMNFEIDLPPSCVAGANAMCAGGSPSVSFDFWIDDLYFVNR
jgi:hypothetical protein